MGSTGTAHTAMTSPGPGAWAAGVSFARPVDGAASLGPPKGASVGVQGPGRDGGSPADQPAGRRAERPIPLWGRVRHTFGKARALPSSTRGTLETEIGGPIDSLRVRGWLRGLIRLGGQPGGLRVLRGPRLAFWCRKGLLSAPTQGRGAGWGMGSEGRAIGSKETKVGGKQGHRGAGIWVAMLNLP